MNLSRDTAVLLLNTGSADAPTTEACRDYLRQFLSDPRVLDMPSWKRWLLLNLIILRTRPPKTAEAYKAIWDEKGSPLVSFSEAFAIKLGERFPDSMVRVAMAYGSPSIPSVLDEVCATGVRRIVVVPMFPQYASATTGSVLECLYKHAAERMNVPSIQVVPPFYEEEVFLDAWGAHAKPILEDFKPDHVLLSFHGLPEFHVRKCDPTGVNCLQRDDCCSDYQNHNPHCYRAHCLATSRGLKSRLGLQPGKFSITFQSRLGRDPWLSPATDETLLRLGREGVKRLAVVSPAFVADCLETLEELGMQGRDAFVEAGGETLCLVPSLNASDVWADALASILRAL